MSHLEERLRQQLPELAARMVESPAAGPDQPVTRIWQRRQNKARRLIQIAAAVAVLAAAAGGARVLLNQPPNAITTTPAPSTAPPNTVPVPPTQPVQTPTTELPTKTQPEQTPTTEPATPTQPEDASAWGAEQLSTGPVLQWTKVESEFAGLFRLQSLGDGRILAWTFAGSPESYMRFDEGSVNIRQVLVTDDGVNWTEVPLPDGLNPDHIDPSGKRWLVIGWDVGAESVSDRSVFFSDDRGTTWTELDIGLPPESVPPWLVERWVLVSAFVSGDNIVAAIKHGAKVEPGALLEGRGLLPEGTTVLSWYMGTSDSVVYTLKSSRGVETLELMYDELGLTDTERRALDANRGTLEATERPLRLLWSDGSTVEVTAEHIASLAVGVATTDGFVLTLVRPSQQQHLTLASSDGRVWSEQPYDYEMALSDLWDTKGIAITGRTIWDTPGDLSRFSVRSRAFGEAPAVVASFTGLRLWRLSAGPAGLAASATSVGASGRVAKNGYELRINEPQGLTTLWDLASGTVLYEYELGTDSIPQGMRVIGEEQWSALVFEDPETGADLVTFTQDDLAAGIFGASEPPTPETWVGWSADGVDWGWQTMEDAFGLQEGLSWPHLGVGRDFVLAGYRDRLFMARVP